MVDRHDINISAKHRLGLTLLELLVVTAIIVILAGMLMVALQKVREKGRRIICMNNLAQMGKAIYLYANDYDGYFVPVWWSSPKSCWPELLQPYLSKWGSVSTGELYKCPSGQEDISCSNDVYYYDYCQLYGINIHLWEEGGLKIEEVPMSSVKILFGEIQHPADVISHYAFHYGMEYCLECPDNEFPEPTTLRGHHLNAYRHNDGANFLFCDGHVQWWPRLGKDWKDPDIDGAYDKHWDLTPP